MKNVRSRFYTDISNTGLILLEEYFNSKDRVLVKCNVCGNEWKINAQELRDRKLCKHCRKDDCSWFKTKCHINGYALSSKFIHISLPVTITCNTCNRSRTLQPLDPIPICECMSWKDEVCNLLNDEGVSYSIVPDMDSICIEGLNGEVLVVVLDEPQHFNNMVNITKDMEINILLDNNSTPLLRISYIERSITMDWIRYFIRYGCKNKITYSNEPLYYDTYKKSIMWNIH